jgi:hypothetical protein
VLLLLVREHCAASQKVAGWIPNGVIGIFYWHNPSGRTTVVESTQPLRNEYKKYLLGMKAARCKDHNLTHFMCRFSWNLGTSTILNTQGLSRLVIWLIYNYLYYYCCVFIKFFHKILKFSKNITYDVCSPCYSVRIRRMRKLWRVQRKERIELDVWFWLVIRKEKTALKPKAQIGGRWRGYVFILFLKNGFIS